MFYKATVQSVLLLGSETWVLSPATLQCLEGFHVKPAAASTVLVLGNFQVPPTFKYLGRLIAFDDDDTQAVRGNLAKARRVWAQISRVSREENASARVCGMFYKATVQSVLLFGSERWVLSPATLQRLEGFHVKAARRMTGLLPKQIGGAWKFPKTKTVLAAAGLHTIKHYVQVRRARILRWVEDRPILNMCRSAKRRRGTTPRLY